MGSVCVSNIGNADSDSPSAMIQLKLEIRLYLPYSGQERHCVYAMRLLYSTGSLCVVTVVCQWIVRLTLSIAQHDADVSLLSPIFVWSWDGRVFFSSVS